jgi:rhodanese-related sulfurtransferase
MKHLLVLCLTVFSFSAFAAPNCNDEKSFPEITKADLQARIADKSAVVIDVNGSKSYAKKHIDTAVDYDTVKKDFAKTLPADKSALVVAYCGGPSCGAWKKAATEACKMGYTNVQHFKEGIKGW